MKRGIPRSWQKGTRAPVVSASDDEAKEARLAAKRIATMFGWCSYCGETVDVAAGKLHDKWCVDATDEQKAKRA